MRAGALTIGLIAVLGCAPAAHKTPTPGSTPTARPSCLSGNAAGPVLSWVRGSTVVDAHADGSLVAAHEFGGTTEVDTLGGRDGFLLASARSAQGREAVLFDSSGVTRWSAAVDADPAPRLGAEGWTIAGSAAFGPDGQRYALHGVPLAEAGAGGWVPTLLQPLQVVALEHPADGTLTPFDEAPASTPVDLRWSGARVVFVAAGSPSAQLAFAAPGSPEDQLALGSGFESARLVSTAGRFVLVEGDTPANLARADLESGVLDFVASVFPDGWSPLEPAAGAEPLALDTDGALLRAFGTDEASALFRSPDLGHTWQQVGDSVPLHDAKRVMSAQHLGSAWVVAAYDFDGNLTTLVQAELVDGARTDVLQAGAIGFGAPLRTPSLDPRGQCAVYWKPDADQAAAAKNAELRVRGTDGVDLALSMEAVPLTAWTPAVWR